MFRFSAPVFPSEDDDVVTSPYNAALAASCLVSSASCVLPVENQALASITNRLEAATAKGTAATNSSLGGPSSAAASRGSSSSSRGASAGAAGGGANAWDAMNGLAANLLLHLTSSVRFEGSLNTDLNDITMNLVGWIVWQSFPVGAWLPVAVCNAHAGRWQACYL